MFERFTDRARRVLVLAQEEARLLNHTFIGTEHILLGLIDEGDGVAAQALARLDITLEGVREHVEKTVGLSGTAPTGSPPFTPRAKKVLELSLREALQLGHNYIGTEHMLLGIVREGEGVAAQALVRMGADLASVRQQVVQLLSGYGAAPTAAPTERQSRDDPRCGRCLSSLREWARYTVIDALPSGPESGEAPARVRVLHCGVCGTPLGPSVQTVLNPVEDPAPVAALPPAPLAVELSHRRGERIDGTVASEVVLLDGDVRQRRGSVAGVFAGERFEASWSAQHGDREDQDRLIEAYGLLDEAPFNLAATLVMQLHPRGGPRVVLKRATIDGELAGEAVHAVAVTPEGALGVRKEILIDGHLGVRPFRLTATVVGAGRLGHVRGSVEGRHVQLDAATDADGERTRVKGEYQGPLDLLALVVGGLLHFVSS